MLDQLKHSNAFLKFTFSHQTEQTMPSGRTYSTSKPESITIVDNKGNPCIWDSGWLRGEEIPQQLFDSWLSDGLIYQVEKNDSYELFAAV